MKPDDVTPPETNGPRDPGPGALPSPPDYLSLVFAEDRLADLITFAEILADDGVVRGLIGPRETPRLWERHLVNCGLLAAALPEGARVADVGSGAGLPGLVLAIARPDLQVTLIEPLLRRTTFLQEVVERLGLGNVVVHRGRADSLHGDQQFDVVTARAVASLETLLQWCMPLVAADGALVAMKGTSVDEEIAAAQTQLKKLGLTEPVVSVLGDEMSQAGLDPIRVVRVAWASPDAARRVHDRGTKTTKGKARSETRRPGSRAKKGNRDKPRNGNG